MTILQVELYEALKKAGVEEDLAKKASSTVFEAKDMVVKNENKFDVRFDRLETRMTILISLNIAILAAFFATLTTLLLR